MATSKSIIEIDVLDQSFKEFQALFARYKADVAQLPDGWKKVDQAIKQVNNPFDKIQKSMKGIQAPFVALNTILSQTKSLLRESATQSDKFRVAAIGAGKAFSVISASAVNTGKSIIGITKSLASWLGIATGIGGALVGGTIFGFDRLAQAQGAQRKQAQGLGVTTGELEASKISFDKILNVESALTKINEMKNDLSKSAPLRALGLSSQDLQGSSVDILEKLIPKLKDITDKGGKNFLGYANARQAGSVVDDTDLTRIKSLTKEEIELAIATNQGRKKELSQSEESLRRWQDFTATLQTAGQHIENVLGDRLVKLSGPIGQLSEAFGNAVAKLLDTGKVDEWINTLSEDIQKFADWLGSDEAEKDFRDFLDGVDTAVGYLEKFAIGISKILDLIPGMGGKALKGSQYKKIDEIAKLDPDLAKELRYKLENPEDYKANAETSFLTGQKIDSPFDTLLKQAQSGPNADRINKLVKALEDNTAATSDNTEIDFGQPSATMGAAGAVASPSKTTGMQNPDVTALAKATEAKYGIPASITLAQYQLESGNGAHMPAGSNNPFGIKAKAGQPYVEAETTEVINGVSQRIIAKFAKFDTLADAFEAHAKLLATAPAYANARKHENDPNAFADALVGVYATDPKYAEKLKKAMAMRTSGGNTALDTQTAVASTGAKPSIMRPMSPQKVDVSIYNSAGADVWTTAHSLTPAST